jgi:hypothetical protein
MIESLINFLHTATIVLTVFAVLVIMGVAGVIYYLNRIETIKPEVDE